ncbi:MFS transporter [Streptomyces javensis]|uniref:MFS transporter n=1 Tax=Streptomyces javensis TaxID=114698 RepID=UPI0033FF36A8
MTAMVRYRVALAHPGAARVMLAAFACRMLAGMVSLALLLAAEDASGSYAQAGFVSGAYAIALAFTSPLWGRIADRRGPRAALAWATSLQSFFFALFVVMAATTAWPPLLVSTAFLAGAATPPASAVSNAVLMEVVPGEDDRRSLFALSGLMTEAVFVGGPLLVAAIVAVLPAVSTVVITAVVSSLGVWWLRAAPAVGAMDRGRPGLAGPGLRLDWNRRQLHIQMVVAAAAFAIGGLQVSVVARADELDASAGLLMAALACGGTLGSFCYGGLRLPGSAPAQLAVVLTLYGAAILALGVGPAAPLTGILLLLVGFVNGPADAIETVLVGRYAAASARSQAFAVLVASNWVGFATGSFVAGLAIQYASPGFGMAMAATAALVAAGSTALAASRPERRTGGGGETGRLYDETAQR